MKCDCAEKSGCCNALGYLWECLMVDYNSAVPGSPVWHALGNLIDEVGK